MAKALRLNILDITEENGWTPDFSHLHVNCGNPKMTNPKHPGTAGCYTCKTVTNTPELFFYPTKSKPLARQIFI